MFNLNPTILRYDQAKIDRINTQMTAVHRLILFCPETTDQDLLGHYLSSMHSFQDILSVKNAQMEAVDDAELAVYLRNLRKSVDFIVGEIAAQREFASVHDLMTLFRIISPEAHERHPNSFRRTLVQVGDYLCPDSERIPSLVDNFFFHLSLIRDPIVRAIYVHHELVRIHPFVDGNGRVSRMAKNWILMYALLPPIYINDASERDAYVRALNSSFRSLDREPNRLPDDTERFFDQELDRLARQVDELHRLLVGTGA